VGPPTRKWTVAAQSIFLWRAATSFNSHFFDVRLKIAVLSRNFSASAGGAERYAVALVEGLATRHELHVFSQFRDHEDPRVNYIAVPRFLVRPRWINQLFFAVSTWWATRRGFDVVHSHENTWHGSIQTVHVLPVWFNYFSGQRDLGRDTAVPQAVRAFFRWVQVCTSPRLLTYLGLEHLRFSPQPGRAVVCVSQTLRQVMAATFPAGEGSLRVIAPGLSAVTGRCSPREQIDARIKLALPTEGRCMLFVGKQFRKKGLPGVLAVMQELAQDICLLAIVADELVDEALEQVREHHLAERVRVLGALSTMELAYRAADCLVHPTLEDTYAMVVLEAMSHGLPVIVSAAEFCGISAELSDGENALLLNDPRSRSELRFAIDRVFDDAGLRDRLSARGSDFARGRMWSEVVVAYEDVFQESVAAR